MIVYADVLFFVNFVSSYIILWLLGKLIIKTHVKSLRLCIASAVGAVAAVVIFSVEMNVFISYFFRTLSAVIMYFITFSGQKRYFLTGMVWLIVISLTIPAAITLTASLAGNITNIASKSGIIYIDLPFRLFIPIFAVSYAVIIGFMRFIQQRRVRRTYIITVTLGEHSITIPALFDSGNLLREPVTGKYVSIIEWESVQKLFDDDYAYDEIINGTASMKLWVVPFHSVGSSSGIIFAFVADKIEILDEKRAVKNVFVGIYNGKLSKNNEYNALLNSALF